MLFFQWDLEVSYYQWQIQTPNLNMTSMREFDPNFGWSHLLGCQSSTQSLASQLREIFWSGRLGEMDLLG